MAHTDEGVKSGSKLATPLWGISHATNKSESYDVKGKGICRVAADKKYILSIFYRAIQH